MKEITAKDLSFNPITEIADEWMLLTAGTEENGYNTMTCSWGHVGSLWGQGRGMGTAICYVRPQRYTKAFIDREELYTLCFFPEGYKKQLGYLGSHSGRNEDKVANAGLTPVFGDGYTYFAEARLTFVCRKLYQAPIREEYFHDRTIVEKHYPTKDFHDMYIGEIVKILVNE